MKKRLADVDYAKAIGIYCVVLGHLGGWGTSSHLISFIYSFHMPLFFFLGGFLLRRDNWKSLIARKSRRLLVPYVAFSLFSYALVRVPTAVSALVAGELLDTGPWDLMRSYVLWPIVGVAYGANASLDSVANPMLWFLPCLFVVHVLFAMVFVPLRHPAGKCMVIVLLPLVAWYSNRFGSSYVSTLPFGRFPWSMDSSIVGLLFFSVGFYAKDVVQSMLRLSVQKTTAIFACTSTPLWWLCVHGCWDISNNAYTGTLLICYVNGLLGIAMVFSLSHILSICLKERRLVVCVSSHTLTIFAAQWIVERTFHRLQASGMPGMAVTSVPFLRAAITVVLGTFVGLAISHYCPWVFGMKRVQKYHSIRYAAVS